MTCRRTFIVLGWVMVAVASCTGSVASKNESALSTSETSGTTRSPFGSLVTKCEGLPEEGALWAGPDVPRQRGYDVSAHVQLPVFEKRLEHSNEDLIATTIKVMLPTNYFEDCDAEFPVLYVMDGQLAFAEEVAESDDSDYLNDELLIDEAFADEAVRASLPAGLKDAVVVAIPAYDVDEEAPGFSRLTRFVPVEDHHDIFEAQIDFVANTVPAYIDANFRTVPDRERRYVAGFSAGSTFASQLLFREPEFAANYLWLLAGDSNNPEVAPSSGNGVTEPRRRTYWSSDAVSDIERAGGANVYLQYGSRATRGFDAEGFTARTQADIDWLLESGFTLTVDRKPEDAMVLHVEPVAHLGGDPHTGLVAVSALVEGLRVLNGDAGSSIGTDQPFKIPDNPTAPPPPIIVNTTTDGVRLRLELPDKTGQVFPSTDHPQTGILRWRIYIGTVSDDGSKIFVDEVDIDAATLDARPELEADGKIRALRKNKEITTDLELTIPNLEPDTTYFFEVAVETRVSLFDDARSGPSDRVIISG